MRHVGSAERLTLGGWYRGAGSGTMGTPKRTGQDVLEGVTMSIPMTSVQVLDRYFLEMRCKVLEVAAALDRIDRASGPAAGDDPRIRLLGEAIETLRRRGPDRAETVQRVFSLPYDEKWQRPKLGE